MRCAFIGEEGWRCARWSAEQERMPWRRKTLVWASRGIVVSHRSLVVGFVEIVDAVFVVKCFRSPASDVSRVGGVVRDGMISSWMIASYCTVC